MSLNDVARTAGVSVATASRVLGGSDHPVSPTTRTRVLQAAQQLGYYPNSVARALVTRQTKTLGVIVGDIVDPYFSAIVRGIEDRAREHGYLAIVCNSDRVPDIELNYVRVLRDYHVDGLIFAGGGLLDDGYRSHLDPLLVDLQRGGFVSVGIGQHRVVSARVDIDNARATEEMTEHLLSLGHRKIAYLIGPAGLATSLVRRDAFQACLRRHGLPLEEDLLIQGDFTLDGGFQATTHLLEQGSPVTAVFAANDQMAIGALLATQKRNLRVPADLTVVGFDDIAAARYVHPPLTTIHVPMYEMGVQAAEAIVRLLRGDTMDRPMVLDHELIVRASSAPPGRGASFGG